VSSKSKSEPIEDGRELRKAQEMKIEFFITGANPAKSLSALEKVFHPMAPAIVAAMPSGGLASPLARRDARLGAGLDQRLPEAIAVVAFVGHCMSLRGQDQIFGRDNVRTLTWSQDHLGGTPATIDQSSQLGVTPALGASNSLILLAASGVGRILVNFDVRGVEMAQSPGCTFGQQIQNGGPQSGLTPTSPPGIDRTPFRKVLRQVTPRTTRSQHVNHRFKHQPMIFGRATAPASSWLYRYRQIYFLNQFFYPLPERVREVEAIRGAHIYKCLNKRSPRRFYSEKLF
jgi:hypothetical protein